MEPTPTIAVASTCGHNPIMLAASAIVFGVSFALYSLTIVAVGLYSSRFARKSDEDYFLAGRSLGKWVAALSASASSESGWVTIGLVGWAFASGVQAYWIIPGCLFGYAFNWFFVAGRMNDRARELGAVTLPDFFCFHFKERTPILRCLSVAVILVAMLLYVAAQFSAAGKAFDASFDGMQYWHGVVLGGLIVLVYTVTGGFRAACWTDFLQALLMVAVLVVFPISLMFGDSGYGYVFERLEEIDPALVEWIPSSAKAGVIAFGGFLLGSGALGINFGYPGQPHVLIRFMALRSRKEAAGAGVIAIVWGAMVYWGAVTVGLMVRAIAVEGGPEWAAPLVGAGEQLAGEKGLILAAKNLIPGVFSGAVLAAVLAAICSTADSQLVVAGSAGSNDLYTRIVATKKKTAHMLVNRLVILALGVIAMLLVIDKDQDIKVYEYVLEYGWAILGASFGPQLILVLFWKRASYRGCIWGMATGFAVAILAKIFAAEIAEIAGVKVYNLPLAFMCALIVNVVVSLLNSDRPDMAAPSSQMGVRGS
ncbi:MAG: sodium/proline symporter [Planctomycetes bacterium]|nr:sodium/proline symporter [Planctomycetota bacterium]